MVTGYSQSVLALFCPLGAAHAFERGNFAATTRCGWRMNTCSFVGCEPKARKRMSVESKSDALAAGVDFDLCCTCFMRYSSAVAELSEVNTRRMI